MRTDLGKLIKMAHDAHEHYNQARTKTQCPAWAKHEDRLYKLLESTYRSAVEGKVEFNPLKLLQARLVAQTYLLLCS